LRRATTTNISVVAVVALDDDALDDGIVVGVDFGAAFAGEACAFAFTCCLWFYFLLSTFSVVVVANDFLC
jgi:hypothetical protein